MNQPPTPNPVPPFEAALEQIERAVAALESGELGLDAALARYEEGVRLLSLCHGLLDGVQRRVTVLAAADAAERPEAVAFDPTAADREPPPAPVSRPEPPPRTRRRVAKPDDDIPF
ncbi:MAG TPA: exodeoxyribonuclease VII small subunit [Isosphaeraceae bacterium]|jgi:exodeoxyribonuclease VII small subunit